MGTGDGGSFYITPLPKLTFIQLLHHYRIPRRKVPIRVDVGHENTLPLEERLVHAEGPILVVPVGKLDEGNLRRTVGAIIQPETKRHYALAVVEEFAQLILGGRLRNVSNVDERTPVVATAATAPTSAV